MVFEQILEKLIFTFICICTKIANSFTLSQKKKFLNLHKEGNSVVIPAKCATRN